MFREFSRDLIFWPILDPTHSGVRSEGVAGSCSSGVVSDIVLDGYGESGDR